MHKARMHVAVILKGFSIRDSKTRTKCESVLVRAALEVLLMASQKESTRLTDVGLRKASHDSVHEIMSAYQHLRGIRIQYDGLQDGLLGCSAEVLFSRRPTPKS